MPLHRALVRYRAQNAAISLNLLIIQPLLTPHPTGSDPFGITNKRPLCFKMRQTRCLRNLNSSSGLIIDQRQEVIAMKLSPLALATAFALSSTFAFAQSSSSGASGSGSTAGALPRPPRQPALQRMERRPASQCRELMLVCRNPVARMAQCQPETRIIPGLSRLRRAASLPVKKMKRMGANSARTCRPQSSCA